MTGEVVVDTMIASSWLGVRVTTRRTRWESLFPFGLGVAVHGGRGDALRGRGRRVGCPKAGGAGLPSIG